MPNQPKDPRRGLPLQTVAGLILTGGAGLALGLYQLSAADLPAAPSFAVPSWFFVGAASGAVLMAAGWIAARTLRTRKPVHTFTHAAAVPGKAKPVDPARFLAAAASTPTNGRRRLTPSLPADEREEKIMALEHHPGTPEPERAVAKKMRTRKRKRGSMKP